MPIAEPPVRPEQDTNTATSYQMPKSPGWLSNTPKPILIGLGLVIGGVFSFPVLGFLGIFLAWIGLFIVFIHAIISIPSLLGRNQIVNRYSSMVEGGKDLGDELLQDLEKRIIETEAPEISIERRTVTTGILGFAGGKRQCLVISNKVNPHLKPFKMYLNARNYGIQLQISWYLANQPGMFQRMINLLAMVPAFGLIMLPLRSAIAGSGGSLGLDIFDEQDLEAYVSNAHHCFMQAIDSLGKAHNIDTSNINRTPKGFLGIS